MEKVQVMKSLSVAVFCVNFFMSNKIVGFEKLKVSAQESNVRSKLYLSGFYVKQERSFFITSFARRELK